MRKMAGKGERAEGRNEPSVPHGWSTSPPDEAHVEHVAQAFHQSPITTPLLIYSVKMLDVSTVEAGSKRATSSSIKCQVRISSTNYQLSTINYHIIS